MMGWMCSEQKQSSKAALTGSSALQQALGMVKFVSVFLHHLVGVIKISQTCIPNTLGYVAA